MANEGGYNRILLKVSGEALMGDQQYGIDLSVVDAIAEEIKAVVDKGTQICLVIGGGNIFRGLSGAASGMDRTSADHIVSTGVVGCSPGGNKCTQLPVGS